MRSRILRLSLIDFRSYAEADLTTEGRTCFLFGPNGAGKTNLLEAISYFSPGRGLRGASLTEVSRRQAGEAPSRAWAVSAVMDLNGVSVPIGTGVESAQSTRRGARLDGESVPVSGLAKSIRPLWLTPAHDRLFSGSASDRRRFLDRLVFSALPNHAAEVSIYERAQRERLRVLMSGQTDRHWLNALEAKASKAGAAIAEARAHAVFVLSAEIVARVASAFPAADLDLTGEWDRMASAGMPRAEIESRLASALVEARGRDAAAGRPLCGPHRTDLRVFDRSSGRSAAECSTGEQKALILNLILAQAARLSRAKDHPNPILLLDEVGAHLDSARRAALFDEIEALSLQAFLTGTEEDLFETLRDRALGVRVDASRLTVME